MLNQNRKKIFNFRFVVLTGAVFLLMFCLGSARAASPFLYTVTRIQDGDSFVATDGNISFEVRIAGIDAPESRQPYGDIAKLHLQNLIFGKKVSIRVLTKPLDQYNRVLGHVFVHDDDIGLKMIQEGLAFYYRPTCKDFPQDQNRYDFDPKPYIKAEEQAQSQLINIWSATPAIEKPCEFRRRKH